MLRFMCAIKQTNSLYRRMIDLHTGLKGQLWHLIQEQEKKMLYTIAVVLVILWLLGLVTSYTMGGLIHILLVIAIVVILLRVISGRKPL